MSRCQGCPDVCVVQWTRGWFLQPGTPIVADLADDGSWHRRQVPSQELRTVDLTNWLPHSSTESDVCVVFASANAIRMCPRCRPIFTDALYIPEPWWSDCCRKSNGYFGCEKTRNTGDNIGYNTWVYFETKHLEKTMVYEWQKFNVFTRWLHQTQKSVIVLFDVCEPAIEHALDLFRGLDAFCSVDPFWIYGQLAMEVAGREDIAVWAVRDQIRAMEKEGTPEGWPRPDYRLLHEIARHAIHVSETLNVTNQTMGRIIAEHDLFMKSELAADRTISQGVQQRLRFAENMLASLRDRSGSNEKRLMNEIQLAFHMIAQHATNTSVEIGRLARLDGVAMKTVAFVTLAFLPSTFVSAIFSMSFFTFSIDDGWAVSGMIWVYWAFAVPLTLGSFLVWRWWQANDSVLSSRCYKGSARFPSGLVKAAAQLSGRTL